MKTLIYKRTHHGDPDEQGVFGINDCMGQVRAWNFEAVIGVGGLGPEPRSHGLDGKVNWIGIGPHKRAVAGKRGPVVTFDNFVFYGSSGPDFETLAPALAERIYSRNVRVTMNDLSATEQAEVKRILSRAKGAPASRGATAHTRSHIEQKPRLRGCSCR